MPTTRTRAEIIRAEILHLMAIRDQLNKVPLIGIITAKQFNDRNGNFNIWRFERKAKEQYLTKLDKFIENNIEKLNQEIETLKTELKTIR